MRAKARVVENWKLNMKFSAGDMDIVSKKEGNRGMLTVKGESFWKFLIVTRWIISHNYF